MASVDVRSEAGVGTIEICNVARHNAMTHAMWDAFADAIEALDARPDVHVIVVVGSGTRAFVSGADIGEFGDRRVLADDRRRHDASVARALRAPVAARKPVIAAIRGICMGGGLGLAAACDLRLCTSDARFRMPAARLGIGYDPVGVARFVSLIGLHDTMDLFATARTFGADEALRMRFVGQVVAPDALESATAELAATIVANAPLTIAAVKLALRSAVADGSESPVLQRRALAACEACNASDDHREGATAFMEKRAPRFEGR